MSFAQAPAFTLREEGGYVDDPVDPGGATNRGITQKTYDAYRHDRGLAPRSVHELQDDEVADLYRTLYWVPAHCDELEPLLALCHFDWAVNHGVDGALATLQRALGVPADGVFGPASRTALDAAHIPTVITRYLQLRRGWYRARVQATPDQSRFLAGWLGRVDRLQAYLEGLA